MLQTTEVQIGAKRYRITQLGASEGVRVLVRLTKVAGDPIAEFLKASGGKSLGDVQLDLLGGAIAKFASALSVEDTEFLIGVFKDKTLIH
jgi:hypothetical protein